MKRIRLYFLGIVFLAIVVLAVYAYFTGQLPGMERRSLGGLTTATTPRATRQALGQTFTYGDVTYTISGVERMNEFRRGKTIAKPLGTFVVVSLAARNNGQAPVKLGPETLVLVDNRGRQYTPDPGVLELLRQNREEGTWTPAISPGLTGQGILVYDVANDAVGLTLRILQGYQDVGLE